MSRSTFFSEIVLSFFVIFEENSLKGIVQKNIIYSLIHKQARVNINDAHNLFFINLQIYTFDKTYNQDDLKIKFFI